MESLRDEFDFIAKGDTLTLTFRSKLHMRSKLHYEVTSLPQGNFTCRYGKLSFGTAWCVFRNTALCGCAEMRSSFFVGVPKKSQTSWGDYLFFEFDKQYRSDSQGDKRDNANYDYRKASRIFVFGIGAYRAVRCFGRSIGNFTDLVFGGVA